MQQNVDTNVIAGIRVTSYVKLEPHVHISTVDYERLILFTPDFVFIC